MKVLDVESLQSGIDYTIKDIESKRDQIQAIQKAVNNFHSLEDTLKGQAGEAIRSFYKDTHEPFLKFLHQSLIHYANILIEIKEAVNSFESSEGGYVRQDFLEIDVAESFDKVGTQTIELTDDANSIIESVQDLVTIKKIDDSEVLEDVRRGKERAKEIVEELTILDEYGASKLEKTKQDLQTMRTFLSDMESMFKSGDLSVRNYNINTITHLTAYHPTMYRDYNR